MESVIPVVVVMVLGMMFGGGLMMLCLREAKPKHEEIEDEDDVDMILITITENDAGAVCVETDAEGMEGTNSHIIMQRMLDTLLRKEYRQVNEEIVH